MRWETDLSPPTSHAEHRLCGSGSKQCNGGAHRYVIRMKPKSLMNGRMAARAASGASANDHVPTKSELPLVAPVAFNTIGSKGGSATVWTFG